jgi:hypothetical protein
MNDKKQAMQAAESMADQINSVVNNMADKMEKPAGAVADLASYGFEQYVWYKFADGLTGVICALLAGIFGTVLVLIVAKLYKKKSKDDADWGFIIVASIIAFFAILVIMPMVLSNNLAQTIAPEGAVISEILKQLK